MTLQKRTLGKSGISISEVGLGLWAAGGDAWGPTDDSLVLSAIDAALDAGITFFDTSDVYGDGHSEELLGKAMKGRRERFIVATKIGWRGFDGDKRRTAYGDVNKLIAGYADGRNVHFLDINAALLNPDGTLSKDVMPDLLHPKESGYSIWQRTMDPTLQKLLNEPR